MTTLDHLLGTQRQPFLILAAEGRIHAANAALERVFGFSPEALAGAPCCRLDGESPPECRHRRFFRDLDPYVETHPLIDAGGVPHLVHIQGFPLLDESGRIYLGESLRLLDAGAHAPEAPVMRGRSAPMQRLLRELAQAAATEAAVLLHGETGSGKELAADFIHRHSARARAPFVIVDCTVLSEDLFESELFGHLKGAFTGAHSDKTGLLELADGGTLFLDEIGELPLSQQPKLLRALESGSFRPVGATGMRQARVRVVSTTHRDLRAMVEHGDFRQDLYYRLAVLPIELPPLRERREDIPLLVEHLLAELTPPGRPRPRFDAQALAKLLAHDFPGNVRELRNLVHLAAALSPSGVIGPESIRLPAPGPSAPPPSAACETPTELDGLSPLEAAEARQILDLMQTHHGNRRAVASALAISERTLYRKLRRYRLNSPGPVPIRGDRARPQIRSIPMRSLRTRAPRCCAGTWRAHAPSAPPLATFSGASVPATSCRRCPR